MKKLVSGALLLITAFTAKTQPLEKGQIGVTPVLTAFSLSDVKLTTGPFRDAQQTDMKYMLALDTGRLLSPFLREAGITPRAKEYGNWENTGLDGHIGGHYLSAVSMMYASTGNPELLHRLNHMVSRLAECQSRNGDGYVGGIPGGKMMWKEIAAGKINAASFDLNKKWVPLYNMHKLFAGLRDAWQIAGNKQAGKVLIALTDWFMALTADLSSAQAQQMLKSEQGGLNEVFANVAELTGDKRYLVLAQKFSHLAILEPLTRSSDQLNGLHANTQIPKVIGYEKIGELSGDKSWTDAAQFFWQTVIDHRTVSIGGNSVREHFNPADDFTSMIESNQGPETCNTYNMLRLTKLLFLRDPEGKYMDYFERALYNHILASQRPEGGFVYFTPMRPRHYRVYSQPQEDFWCCVGSGLENHAKYGDLIYAHTNQDLFVNLFISSTLRWKEKDLNLIQETRFPAEERSVLKLSLRAPSAFNLAIRYPSWVKPGDLSILVNGRAVPVASTSSSYVSIRRTWKTGDIVVVRLPMHNSVEYLPDGSAWASFIHGPIVLASATGTKDQNGLIADGSRMGHIAGGPMYPINEAPMFIKTSADISSELQPVKGRELTYTVPGALFPAKFKDLELVPFYTIKDSRYMIYWPVTDRAGAEQKQIDMQQKEKDLLQLEARTVDQVAPGEQQPEVDHNFKGEHTNTGVYEGRSWRDGTGWFSYDLKNNEHMGKKLRITYSGADRGRQFSIYANERLISDVFTDSSRGKGFYDIDYDLPNDPALNEGHLTIRFQAKNSSVAGGIYYVRLLK